MLNRLINQILIAFIALFSLMAFVSYYLIHNQKDTIDKMVHISDELLPLAQYSDLLRRSVQNLSYKTYEYANVENALLRENIKNDTAFEIEEIKFHIKNLEQRFESYIHPEEIEELKTKILRQMVVTENFFDIDNRISDLKSKRTSTLERLKDDMYALSFMYKEEKNKLMNSLGSEVYIVEPSFISFEKHIHQSHQILMSLPAINDLFQMEDLESELNEHFMLAKHYAEEIVRLSKPSSLDPVLLKYLAAINIGQHQEWDIFDLHLKWLNAVEHRRILYAQNSGDLNQLVRWLNVINATMQNKMKAAKQISLETAFYSLKTSGIAIFVGLAFIIYVGCHIFLRVKKPMEDAIESLEDSETRFKEFAAMAADWFWEGNDEFHLTYVSNYHEAILGKLYVNHIGQSAVTVFGEHFEDKGAWETCCQKALQGDKSSLESFCVMYDGSRKRIKMDIWPIMKSGKCVGFRGVGKDITMSHELSVQLRYQAEHDSLTGLYNRHSLEDSLDQCFSEAEKIPHEQQHCLCFVDLDRFKVVNDTAGHAAGDDLLKQVSRLLLSIVRKQDQVFRIGGDEFAILLDNCPLQNGKVVCDKIVAELNVFRFTYEEKKYFIGSSIGLVAFSGRDIHWNQVILQADLACRMAKELGRNRVHVYRDSDVNVKQRQSEVIQAAGIKEAMIEERFILYVQPIVPVKNLKAMDSGEILVRLIGKDGEMVPPIHFIPAAERYGIMPELDRYIIRKTLIDHGALFKDWTHIGLNISGTSLNDESMINFVKEVLAESIIHPSQVCLEITETAAVSNLATANHFVDELLKIGCRFALDDFGSGVSSFGYLKRFSIQFLKIDGCFVADIDKDEVNYATVSAIIDVAHTLNLKVIAEYVENQTIIDILKSLRADYLQGYGVGKPMPVEDLPRQNKDANQY